MSGLRGALISSLVLSLAAGCPDPNPVGSYEDLSQGGPGTAPAAAANSAGADVAEDPGATQPNDARFKVKAGEGVEVSGTFEYAGTIEGMRRLDFRSIPAEGGPPRLVHTLEVRSGGTWSIEAPPDYGKLQIHAFIDKDGDGPTKGDPGYLTDPPLEIGTEAITEVVLALTDDFDPAALAPGGAPGAMRAMQGDPGAGGEDPPTPEGGDPDAGPADGAPTPVPPPSAETQQPAEPAPGPGADAG